MKPKLSLPVPNKRDVSVFSSAIKVQSLNHHESDGTSVRTLDNSGLIETLSLGKTDAFRLAVMNNQDQLNSRDSLGLTLLMLTVCKKFEPSLIRDHCKILIENKADVNTVDFEGYSVLHWAAACSDLPSRQSL